MRQRLRRVCGFPAVTAALAALVGCSGPLPPRTGTDYQPGVPIMAATAKPPPHPRDLPDSVAPVPGADEWLSRADVRERFCRRASPEERRRFERFVARADPASRTHALELVLFQLTGDELYEVGIIQVGGDWTGDLMWMLAGTTDSRESHAAISEALGRFRIGAYGSGNHGYIGWYVSADEFFLARDALLKSREFQSLDYHHVNDLKLKGPATSPDTGLGQPPTQAGG